MPKKKRRKSKPIAEAVARHLQEIIDRVAHNVGASAVPPNVDIEVIELSEDEFNPDFCVIHEFFELKEEHEENNVSRRHLKLCPRNPRRS